MYNMEGEIWTISNSISPNSPPEVLLRTGVKVWHTSAVVPVWLSRFEQQYRMSEMWIFSQQLGGEGDLVERLRELCGPPDPAVAKLIRPKSLRARCEEGKQLPKNTSPIQVWREHNKKWSALHRSSWGCLVGDQLLLLCATVMGWGGIMSRCWNKFNLECSTFFSSKIKVITS